MMPSQKPINQKSPRSAMPAKQQSLPHRPQSSPKDSETTSSGSEDDMSPNQQGGLYDAINEKLVRSEFSKKNFLPEDDFEMLMTRNAIEEELENAALDFRPSLVEYIAKHARKTFATLVIQDKVEKARNLEKFGFDDRYLPIAVQESYLTSLNGFSRDSLAWKWFCKWKRQVKDEFCEKQWLFLSHVFQSDSMMEDLHQDCRLPFLTCEFKSEAGSFSFVHKATIHHSHHTVGSDRSDNLFIAIKELRDKAIGADQRELDALNLARQLQHPHIVKFVGGFRQGSTSHLLFQWADGGNLRSYWKDPGNWSRDGDLIKWTIEQIKGLFAALSKWHDLDSSSTPLNGRHGDLKPENILRSLRAHGRQRGIFQIADLGLAKIHSLPTHARDIRSSTPCGTQRYRPPEAYPKISRSYDMWSMGCITLEWIIWLVYGIDELDAFYQQACPEDYDSFWSRNSDDHPLHPRVVSWMKHMTDTCLADGEHCYSIALRKLLIFVKDRLLVPDAAGQDAADITQQSIEGSIGGSNLPIFITSALDAKSVPFLSVRAKCKDSCVELENISLIPNGVPHYMHNPMVDMNGRNRRGPRPPIPSTLQVPSSTSSSRPEKSRDLVRLHHQRQNKGGIADTKNPYAMPSTLNVWMTHFDNLFAKTVFGILGDDEISRLAPAYPILTPLCQHCSSMKTGIFSGGSFLVSYEKAQTCQISCALCAVAYKMMGSTTGESKFKMMLREGSSLTSARGESPLLSLVVGPSPGLNRFPDNYQRGFPVLPTPGSSIQVKLLKRWIKWCDLHHECKPTKIVMPRRLVDVYPREGCDGRGRGDPDTLRLDCNDTRKDNKYVALTHLWGDPSLHGSFHFLSCGKLERWQKHLDLRMLPRTFQDAVKITRSLGIRYLWVDALCIIQDDAEDLQDQIGKMEEVYRCAYVTLSATCATGSDDGFLKTDRKIRRHYPLSYSNQMGNVDMIYLCDPMDDFERHVEQSALSKRGWVFQERALSRRIIHFTEVQVYWECGKGIRCETLSTQYNQKTSFLSDPQFPDAMLKRYKGMRIAFFEEIYKRYSQLDFTHPTDRSLGMAGIESRFAELFGKARYGILDEPRERSYLRRSLLWRRADLSKVLTKIDYPPNKQVLSWSWMAVMGPICFMDIPFGAVDWSPDLGSPFDDCEDLGDTAGALRGGARNFFRHHNDRIFFDRSTDGHSYDKIQCVVLGTQDISNSRLVTHYGLLAVVAESGGSIYERVGVATFERDETWMEQEHAQWIRIM